MTSAAFDDRSAGGPAASRTGKRAIAMFAKAPTPGDVKTRLSPPLSMRQAAQLARAFLSDSGKLVVRAAAETNATPICMYAPADAASRLAGLLPAQIVLHQQSDGDLTDRLRAAYVLLAEEGLSHVCFIGADSPTMPKRSIGAAFAYLDDGHDLVVGPASDGGYYLLALREPHLDVFAGIAWSTSDVCAQTLARASNLGLSVHMLPEWYDVDDAAALQRLTLELLEDASPDRAGDAPDTYRLLTDWRDSMQVFR